MHPPKLPNWTNGKWLDVPLGQQCVMCMSILRTICYIICIYVYTCCIDCQRIQYLLHLLQNIFINCVHIFSHICYHMFICFLTLNTIYILYQLFLAAFDLQVVRTADCLGVSKAGIETEGRRKLEFHSKTVWRWWTQSGKVRTWSWGSINNPLSNGKQPCPFNCKAAHIDCKSMFINFINRTGRHLSESWSDSANAFFTQTLPQYLTHQEGQKSTLCSQWPTWTKRRVGNSSYQLGKRQHEIRITTSQYISLLTFKKPQGRLSKRQRAHAINVSFSGICTSLHQCLSDLRIALQNGIVQRLPKQSWDSLRPPDKTYKIIKNWDGSCKQVEKNYVQI